MYCLYRFARNIWYVVICLRMDIDSVIDMMDSLCDVIDAVPVMENSFYYLYVHNTIHVCYLMFTFKNFIHTYW